MKLSIKNLMKNMFLIKRKFYLKFFSKGKYFCPFCNKSYSKLMSCGSRLKIFKDKKIIGGGRRKNSVCPNCMSYDRERLIYIFLKEKKLLNKKGLKVLHVAPEKNLQRVFNKMGIENISVDLESPLADIRMDITNITYPDNSFDAIICNHILEHIPHDIVAIKELYRVLKKGGWAILQVPFSLVLPKTYENEKIVNFKDRQKFFGQKDHVRIYGKDYVERLKSGGFKVDYIKLGNKLSERYALNKGEGFFSAKNEVKSTNPKRSVF